MSQNGNLLRFDGHGNLVVRYPNSIVGLLTPFCLRGRREHITGLRRFKLMLGRVVIFHFVGKTSNDPSQPGQHAVHQRILMPVVAAHYLDILNRHVEKTIAIANKNGGRIPANYRQTQRMLNDQDTLRDLGMLACNRTHR